MSDYFYSVDVLIAQWAREYGTFWYWNNRMGGLANEENQ